SAFAQSLNLSAHIPFDFSVGNATLNSGEYAARITSGSVLYLEDKDGHRVVNAGIMAVPNRGASAKQGRLEFRRYGNQYYLYRAFWSGYDQGYELVKPLAQLEAAKKLKGEDVTIMAKVSRLRN